MVFVTVLHRCCLQILALFVCVCVCLWAGFVPITRLSPLRTQVPFTVFFFWHGLQKPVLCSWRGVASQSREAHVLLLLLLFLRGAFVLAGLGLAKGSEENVKVVDVRKNRDVELGGCLPRSTVSSYFLFKRKGISHSLVELLAVAPYSLFLYFCNYSVTASRKRWSHIFFFLLIICLLD